jgi:urea transporter
LLTDMEQLRDNSVFRFAATLLRGVGNVVFQDYPLTGLLVIIGIAVNSWTAAVSFLIGAAIATLVAMWFKADKLAVEHGMFAFSGGYVGLLVGVFAAPELQAPSAELLLFVVMGGILAVPLTAGLNLAFAKLNLSATAFPILILMWALLAGILYTDLPANSVAPQILPASPDKAAPYSWETFVFGTLNGLGQIFAQVNPLTGALILAGILLNSRVGGLMVVLAGMLSVGLGWALGYDEETVRNGVMSFNPILTCMALGGFFLYLTWRSVLYALLGALLSMWAFVALAALLNPLGLPALTVGFVVVTWIMLLGAQAFDFVKLVPLARLSKPEEHLKHAEA